MNIKDLPENIIASFHKGVVIPAHPLALTSERRMDERRMRALTRYYLAASAGGLAVGVHSTQFEIREPGIDLLEPVLSIVSDTITAMPGGESCIKIAGICGNTAQAIAEAELALDLGYHAGLLSLAALKEAGVDELVQHCRELAGVIPLVGFYLQPAAGGRLLPYRFWAQFAQIENVLAIKMAPFNRYQTLDVVRGVCASGRADEIALYTGNDDNIVVDLLTEYSLATPEGRKRKRIVGGLLGHWAVWTKKAVELLEECHAVARTGDGVPGEMLTHNVSVTDTNAVFFDAANGFAGGIPGIHEVLRRQGLLQGIWCLNPKEQLSPGQSEEIDRVYREYPDLNDDEFVREHLDEWLD